MKKIISVFLLLAFVLSLVPNYSAQELPGRDFFIDEKGNPQALIVVSEYATAKDIQRVAEVVTKITNETYYSVTGTDEKIIWESDSFVEDDHDNVALGYTGVKSNLDYIIDSRSFTTPSYYFSHSYLDPTPYAPAWPNCPFYVESMDALFDGDRNTRIIASTGYNYWELYYSKRDVIVKFNNFKTITDVNFTHENTVTVPANAGYTIYYLQSLCPNTYVEDNGISGNWIELPAQGIIWPVTGSSTKRTDTYTLTKPITTNALLVVLNPLSGGFAWPPTS